MADKFRRTFPISISFVDGEQPTAAKLNAVSGQARNGLSLVERAIGDIWNQSGDPATSPSGDITANALHIPNIARALGDLALLNPRIPELSDIETYFDAIGLTHEGAIRAYLRYPVNTSAAITLGGTFAPLVQGQLQTAPTSVDSTGDWYVSAAGLLITFDPIPSGLILQYEPVLASDITGSDWSVIPDPSTWA